MNMMNKGAILGEDEETRTLVAPSADIKTGRYDRPPEPLHRI